MKGSGRGGGKPKVVIDTNVFVAGVFWLGSARECLVAFARRQFDFIASEAILQEYAETAWELKARENLPQNPQPWLTWINTRVTIIAPIPLTEPVSADSDDDKFIECALATGADYLVSRDRHLLRLEKPFGILVRDDRQFLGFLARIGRRPS